MIRWIAMIPSMSISGRSRHEIHRAPTNRVFTLPGRSPFNGAVSDSAARDDQLAPHLMSVLKRVFRI